MTLEVTLRCNIIEMTRVDIKKLEDKYKGKFLSGSYQYGKSVIIFQLYKRY